MQSRRLASLPSKCFPWDFLQNVQASASLPPTPPPPPPPHTTSWCWISSPNICLAVRAAPFSVFCSLAAKNFNCIAVNYIVYTHGLDWIPFSYKNELTFLNATKKNMAVDTLNMRLCWLWHCELHVKSHYERKWHIRPELNQVSEAWSN